MLQEHIEGVQPLALRSRIPDRLNRAKSDPAQQLRKLRGEAFVERGGCQLLPSELKVVAKGGGLSAADRREREHGRVDPLTSGAEGRGDKRDQEASPKRELSGPSGGGAPSSAEHKADDLRDLPSALAELELELELEEQAEMRRGTGAPIRVMGDTVVTETAGEALDLRVTETAGEDGSATRPREEDTPRWRRAPQQGQAPPADEATQAGSFDNAQESQRPTCPPTGRDADAIEGARGGWWTSSRRGGGGTGSCPPGTRPAICFRERWLF